MGVIARARDLFARRGESRPGGVIARIVPRWLENRPLPHKGNTRKLLDEGYRKHSIIHVCIRELAQTAAEPVPRIMRNGVFVDEHPALALLETPNPLQTGFEFVELLITYLQSVGNAYVHKVRSKAGRVVELWLLRPDRTRIVPGPDGMVARYEFRIDGEATGVSVPPEDVVHFRLPDVLDDYYGLPPVAVAAQIADLDTNAIDYLRAFFLNSGTPAGILKFKIRVDKPDRERVKEEWIEQHTGLAGWHSISVLDADAEYQPIGANVKEANVEHVFDVTESRLPAIWGVPPIIVGMRLGLLRSTYSNYKEARTSFWGETARPLYRRLQGKLTAGVVREFDERGKLVFDLSDVEALQESIDSRRTFAIDGWREGLLDRKQSLEIVGMEAEPGDEGLFVTDALMTMASGDPIEVLGARSIEVEATPAPRQIPGPRQAHDDAPEPPWTALHRVADQGALAVRRTFLRAVATAVNGTVLRKVEAALRAKDYAGAEAAIPWESTAVRTLEAEIPEELRKVVVEAGVASEKVQPRTLDFVFNRSDPVSVEWAAARSSELVTEVTTVTRQAIRDAVARAIDEGRGARVAAREIRDVIGLTRRQEQSIENLRARLVAENLAADKIQEKLRKARQKLVRRRALLISRTESMSAANFGQQRLWEQAMEKGLIDRQAYREWVVSPDDRLCPFCAPMQGKRTLLQERFDSGQVERRNGNSVQLPSVLTPPLHPNCLPGDARVSAEAISATSKRWYDGDLVVLRTASGKQLSCTPNHPILTTAGWVAAGRLDVGGYVVSSLSREWKSAGDLHDEQMPPTIQDVTETFGRSEKMATRPVPVSPEDFHGDGEGSEVAIVGADRLLMDRLDAALAEQRRQLALSAADVKLPGLDGLGSSSLFFYRRDAALRGLVGSSDLPLPRCPIHARPLRRLRFALAAWSDPGIQKSPTDHVARDAEAGGHSILGIAGEVAPDDLGSGQILSALQAHSAVRLTLGPECRAALDQAALQAVELDAVTSAELHQRRAEFVFADQIVSVDHRGFSGHVYNLQTASELYVAEGIVTHNCRCVMRLIVD